MPHFLDVLVEGGGFRLQSFPFPGPDICAKHFAFDSRALAFEMRQQFLIVFIKFANGSVDRASRRNSVVPSLTLPSPHHAIMPQPLALAGLHPCQFVKKTVAVIPSRNAARDLLVPSVSAKCVPLATTGTTIKIHSSANCYCALAAAGRTGRAGRGGTTAGTAKERAPFLPTVRMAKKWLSGETPSSTRVMIPGVASFTFGVGWTLAVALTFVSLAARRCSRLLPGTVASLYP